jgi:hypothetical protein
MTFECPWISGGYFVWVTPKPMKMEFPDAVRLIRAKDLPTLSLSLEVTGAQFSHMLRMLESKRRKDFLFTVDRGLRRFMADP